ncbi:phosphotriesterase family protein [Jiangella muralis]|uniref:phosphotriesterase family protein n=1 Tax=Jiangella muralis TaxID=702383 RepID=UPI00069D8CF3|nr:hypothetical protein [Jiangella muralis]
MSEHDAGRERPSVQTVLGPVPVADLGTTLTHEHVLVDATKFFVPDPDPLIALELERGMVAENLGHLKRSLVNCMDDLFMDDDAVAAHELLRFKHRGGRTVMDVTCHGIRQRNHARRVAEIAKATRLNIILGTGAYTQLHHPRWIGESNEDELAAVFIRELVDGVSDAMPWNPGSTETTASAGPRCGFIGEIGIGTPMLDSERKVLAASLTAHHATGAPLVIHQTDHDGATRFEVLNLLESGSVDPRSVVIGHVGHLEEFDVLKKILERGVYVALDTFGLAGNWLLRELPSELEYARRVRDILDAGFADQLLLSHDVGHKRLLRTYGGTGFDHLSVDLPPLLEALGVDPDVLDHLMRVNPARLFAHASAPAR